MANSYLGKTTLNEDSFSTNKAERCLRTQYSREELITAAKVYADKLNKAKGPVKILFPTWGWSSLDREGSVLHAPEEDKVFVEELRRSLKPEIEIKELDCHLEDAEFALALVETFVQMDQSGK